MNNILKKARFICSLVHKFHVIDRAYFQKCILPQQTCGFVIIGTTADSLILAYSISCLHVICYCPDATILTLPSQHYYQSITDCSYKLNASVLILPSRYNIAESKEWYTKPYYMHLLFSVKLEK